MSDQLPIVDPPVPAPDPPVAVSPTEEGSQVIPDPQGAAVGPPANYVEHVLDAPYEGWAYNDSARIFLSGQRIFVLHDDGTPIVYGTPPDLT